MPKPANPGEVERVFNAAKDAVASRVALAYLNSLAGRYGRVRELKIDSRSKKVVVIAELLGESETVTLRIDSYRILEEGQLRFIEVTACSCSREWLQNLLLDHVRDQKLKLPAWAAGAL